MTSRTTEKEFDQIIHQCKDIFTKKNRDYGTSWRILRPSSLTDQIYIKAQRIRSIEEKGINLVPEGVEDELAGIINYCVITLIQLQLINQTAEPTESELINLYDQQVSTARQLMLAKNHDYGEAWREMRISTFTDLILTKLLRIRQIEDNKGKTLISEGLDANYLDIMNYAIFALIRINSNG